MTKNEDKNIEQERFNRRASIKLSNKYKFNKWGAESIEPYLRAPYLFYEEQIKKFVEDTHNILEIGAGCGRHTLCLLNTGGRVVASDISPQSLEIIKRDMRNSYHDRIETLIADMESLPVSDNSFDIVTSAGSLSYGDPEKVKNEIYRVLKPNGCYICVDSLNHNPIYKFNRWLNFLRGKRTKSTLKRIPNLDLINKYIYRFDSVKCKYFGAISWAAPLLSKFFSASLTASFSNSFDSFIGVKSSAFKFVMVAIKG